MVPAARHQDVELWPPPVRERTRLSMLAKAIFCGNMQPFDAPRCGPARDTNWKIAT
jgi:hypothetical protein